jgi:osmotically-inducible protein OsmY
MTDLELAARVRDELFWDPKVDPEEIAAAVDDGDVALRGTVGSFRQKREVTRATERVYGVTNVNINELDVRILTEARRDDAELRGAVLQALILDGAVPETIDATVKEGVVTLTGTAEWQFQRDEAEFVAGNLPGVIDVSDTIYLLGPTASAGEIAQSINDALVRSANVDHDRLSVTASNGEVTIEGAVSSWADHDEALAAAWGSPGVAMVNDHIVVAY